MQNHQINIHIDQKEYHSLTPTSGIDLYELAKIPSDRVLYRKVEGDAKEKLIRIDDPSVHLTQGEHIYSADAPEHHFAIVVNTDPFIVDHNVLTFDELVKLAYPQPPTGLDPEFTVSFEHAKSQPHHGDLAKNGFVTVKKHGTIFDVGHTNRS